MTISERLNDWRRVYDLLHRTSFEKAFNQVVKEDNQQALDELQQLLDAGRSHGLRIWIKKYWHKDITEYSIKELRLEASKYNVHRYYLLSKQELLHTILEIRNGPPYCPKCKQRHIVDITCPVNGGTKNG